jgi:DNA-binding transcriptional regulator YhcF (GntR family)
MKKFEMFNMICNNCNLTSKEKLVAHYFVYRSNQAGICYPAVNTIAKHCGVSERTIQRATKKLQERGYINISKRDIKGRQTSNGYKLILEPDKIDSISKIELVDTPVCDSKEEQMNVVLLEDILMISAKQSVNYFDIGSILNEASCTGIMIKAEVSPSLITETPKSIVMSEDTSQNMRFTNEDAQDIIASVRTSYVSIFKIITIIWLYNRNCYIYRNSNIILKIGKIAPGVALEAALEAALEEKLAIYRYDIQCSRFLMSNLGVPP